MKVVIIAALLVAALGDAALAKKRSCTAKSADGCVQFAGKSGWLEFCRGGEADPSAGDEGGDRNCVSLRPFRFSEVDADGADVTGTGINKLTTSLGSAGVTKVEMRKCNGTGVNETAIACCEGGAVNFTNIPIQVALANSKTMAIDAMIAESKCEKMYYLGESASVAAGQFKFSIDISGYSAKTQSRGISFDLIVKIKGQSQFSVKKEGKKAIVGDGAIVNYGNFIIVNGASAAVSTALVEAKTRGNQLVLSYTLKGGSTSFTGIAYDPVVTVSETNINGVAATSVIVAFATAALVALLSVAM